MKTYKERVFDAVGSFVQVYSRYVKFDEKDRSKANRMVFCPFHDDKNKPSLSIRVSNGLFYCFSCQAKGDVVDFYKRMFGLDFKEAIARLGKDVGVEPSENDFGGNGKDKEPKYGDSDFADFIDDSGAWSFGGDSSDSPECGNCNQGKKESGQAGEGITGVATATKTTTGDNQLQADNEGDKVSDGNNGNNGNSNTGGSAKIQQPGTSSKASGETESKPVAKKERHPDLKEEVLDRYHKNLTLDKLKFFESRKISLDVITKLKIGYKNGHYVWPIRKNGELHTYKFYKPVNGTDKKEIYQIKGEDLGYSPYWIFPEPDPTQEVVFLFEGETDTLCALSMGLNACTGTAGASTFKEDIISYFEKKIVYVCYDIDQTGVDGARKAASAINYVAKKTYIINLPLDLEKYPKGDFTDWVVRENHNINDFLSLIKKLKPIPKEMFDKPYITSANVDLQKTIESSWEAIKEHNNPEHIFYMGGCAIRLMEDLSGFANIRNVDQYSMQFELSEAANWFIYSKDDNQNKKGINKKLTRPPIAVSRAMLEDNLSKKLPVLDRIVYSPVASQNGNIITEPGYSKEACVYYVDNGIDIPDLPEKPTSEDISDARSLLMDELLIDFPFMSDADRANAIGLLILPFVSEMIKVPTPNHLIEKPTPGTGASLLVDIFSLISQNRPAAVMSEGSDNEEWRKRITAVLMDSPAIVLIDNISRNVDSSALSTALTAPVWTDRILGASKNITIPIRCAWVMTGNNPSFSVEMARRTVSIRMDAKVEKPWQRDSNKFKHPNLREWVKENRNRLIYAVLIMIKNWVVLGKPLPKNKLGGFEVWSNVVGGIMNSSGFTEHLSNLEIFYERSDLETEILSSLAKAWKKEYGSDPVTVSDLFKIIENIPFELGSGGERSQKIKLGKKVKKMNGTRYTINGVRHIVQKDGITDGSVRFVLRVETPAESHQLGENKELSTGDSKMEYKETQQLVAFGKQTVARGVDLNSPSTPLDENSMISNKKGSEGSKGSVASRIRFADVGYHEKYMEGGDSPYSPHSPSVMSTEGISGSTSDSEEKLPSLPLEDPIIGELRQKLNKIRSESNGSEEVKNYLQMAEDQISRGNIVFADSYIEKARSLMKGNSK